MPAAAYLITFRTYGTQLPGDDRGSTTKQGGYRPPNAPLRRHAERLLKHAPVSLCEVARPIVLRYGRGLTFATPSGFNHLRMRSWQVSSSPRSLPAALMANWTRRFFAKAASSSPSSSGQYTP